MKINLMINNVFSVCDTQIYITPFVTPFMYHSEYFFSPDEATVFRKTVAHIFFRYFEQYEN